MKKKKLLCGKRVGSLLMMVIVAFLSVSVVLPASVEGANSKELTKKDFVYSYKENGKKKTCDVYKSIESSKQNDPTWGYYYAFIKIGSDEKKASKDDYKTYRGIKIGSNYKNVIKKYGKANKIKHNKKSQLGRWVCCDNTIYVKDLSYYVRYDMKSTNYSIVFFFDKSNKVIDVYYFYSINEFGKNSTADEETRIDFFDVPRGEKITKSYFRGKTIYEIPGKSLTTGVIRNRIAGEGSYYLVDENGNDIATTDAENALYTSSGENVYDVLVNADWYHKDTFWQDNPKRLSKAVIRKYLDNPNSYQFLLADRCYFDDKNHTVRKYFRFKIK